MAYNLFLKIFPFILKKAIKLPWWQEMVPARSTLLKILAGKETPDEGKVWINKDVDVALFEQEPIFEETKSILDNIFFHNHPVINAIKEYEAII